MTLHLGPLLAAVLGCKDNFFSIPLPKYVLWGRVYTWQGWNEYGTAETLGQWLYILARLHIQSDRQRKLAWCSTFQNDVPRNGVLWQWWWKDNGNSRKRSRSTDHSLRHSPGIYLICRQSRRRALLMESGSALKHCSSQPYIITQEKKVELTWVGLAMCSTRAPLFVLPTWPQIDLHSEVAAQYLNVDHCEI